MRFQQAVDHFLQHLEVEKDYSPLTVRVYAHYLNRFLGWLDENAPDIEVQDLDLEVLRNFRLHLARYVTPSGQRLKKTTQTYHLIALRAVLRYLSVLRGLETLAPDRIELAKSGGRSIKFLQTEEVDRLLAVPDTNKIAGLRDRAILESLFSTGLRVSELTQLNRDQIDLDRRELGIIGKGKKPRVVFLSDGAAEWIGRYLKAREDYYKPLFIRHKGSGDISKGGENMRLTPRSIQMIVDKYARLARLQVKASPHTLRHSFATDLLIAGADIRSVQEMLGHESITTTQVYTHVTDSHLKEVHRTFHGRRKTTGHREEQDGPAEIMDDLEETEEDGLTERPD